MQKITPKKNPIPGKRVFQTHNTNDSQPSSSKRGLFMELSNTWIPTFTDPTLITISHLKTLEFSIDDHSEKFFGKVLYLLPPRTHKSNDVFYHRRPFVIADANNYIAGYIRSNNDNVIVLGHSYFFSKFKVLNFSELMLHETSTILE